MQYCDCQFRQIWGSRWSAWFKGWRPTGACAAFIKWTEWILAVAVPWWPQHKHRLILSLLWRVDCWTRCWPFVARVFQNVLHKMFQACFWSRRLSLRLTHVRWCLEVAKWKRLSLHRLERARKPWSTTTTMEPTNACTLLMNKACHLPVAISWLTRIIYTTNNDIINDNDVF